MAAKKSSGRVASKTAKASKQRNERRPRADVRTAAIAKAEKILRCGATWLVEPEGGWGVIKEALDAGVLDPILNDWSPLPPRAGECLSPTILTMLAATGRAELVSSALRRGADVNRHFARRSRGEPNPTDALHAAASAGSLDVARLLLEAGADPNFAESPGATPITAAFHYKNEGLVDLLLPVTNLATVDVSGHSPIRYARAWGNTRILQAVREKLVQEYAGRPVRTLRVVRPETPPRGPLSRFARPRLSALTEWVVLAAQVDVATLVNAAQIVGRYEPHCANRRVLGERASYALRLVGSPWSVLILEPTGRHLHRWQDERRAMTASASERLGSQAVILSEGMLFTVWSGGRKESVIDYRPMEHARVAGCSVAVAERLMLERADALFLGHDLVIPNVLEQGDGMEVALDVELTPTESVERLDVIVTVD